MKYILALLVPVLSISIMPVNAQLAPNTDRYQTIVHNSAKILKAQHYSVRDFDDTFSTNLFYYYFGMLDYRHAFFLQGDIDALEQYSTRLDDELNGAPVQFVWEAIKRFRAEVKTSWTICSSMLNQPFDLSQHDSFKLGSQEMVYPKNRKEQLERWRKWLTCEIESEMYSLKTDEDQNAGKLSVAQLEQEARKIVKIKLEAECNHLLYKLDDEDYFDYYMNAVTYLLDPHSNYIGRKMQLAYASRLGGVVCGTGLYLEVKHGMIYVGEVLPGGPAMQSGKIKKGDVILSVKQEKGKPEQIKGYQMNWVGSLLQGEEDTKVTLNLKRPNGTKYSVTLIRKPIETNESLIKTAVIEKQTEKIGYIEFPYFYSGNGRRSDIDFGTALVNLKKEGVKAIILDIRNNPGGAAPSAVDIIGDFIPYGAVVQTKDSKNFIKTLSDQNKGTMFDGPLVVLVNGNSYSASELSSSALQDYNRALIIGSPTGGKGTAQYQMPVVDEKLQAGVKPTQELGILKLTREKFYRISGGSVQKKGVVPDVVVPDDMEYQYQRENTMRSALPWDSIAPAKYPAWNFGFDMALAKEKIQMQVDQDDSFKQIAQNQVWLKEAQLRPYSLNWKTYYKDRVEMDKFINESKALTYLKQKQNVKLLEDGHASNNRKFLDKVETSRYIDLAVAAALEMIKNKQNP